MTFTSCAERPLERRSAIVMSPVIANAEGLGLVDVRTFLPDVAVDLRYSTGHNITRRPLYPADMPCLLRRSTAIKLKRVQERLRAQGYGLRIWDAWRPPEVQMTLVEKGGNTGMFLDPKVGWSKHCSGVAVDITLIDLAGNELRLPTAHDENSRKAYVQYMGNDPEIKRNLLLLQNTMCEEGFTTIPLEWWHFDDYEWFETPPPPVFARQIQLALPDN